MTGHIEHSSFEPTREDVLIGRVADGEASPLDWSELEQIASRDGGVWERLARAQRTHARLTCAVEDAIAVADLVELPSLRGEQSWSSRIYQYGGWAMAAMVAVSWIGLTMFGGRGSGPSGVRPMPNDRIAQVPTQGAGPGLAIVPAGFEEAYDQYLNTGMAQGRVITEMQPMFVEARPAQSGQGYELVFVRQILERKTVDDLQFLNLSKNEHGQPVYVPANKPGLMQGNQTF